MQVMQPKNDRSLASSPIASVGINPTVFIILGINIELKMAKSIQECHQTAISKFAASGTTPPLP